MKKQHIPYLTPALVVLFWLFSGSSCLEPECDYEIRFEEGALPSAPLNIEDLNTTYNDYNSSIPAVLQNGFYLLFSSDRESEGSRYDIFPSYLYSEFNQTSGDFALTAFSGEDNLEQFYLDLAAEISTTANDYGPFSFFSNQEGSNYYFTTTDMEGNLDIRFLQFSPYYPGQSYTFYTNDFMTLINTSANESYAIFDQDLNQLFYCSDKDGDTDIYALPYSSEGGMTLENWFTMEGGAGALVDSINSDAEEMCPYIFNNRMYFASNREGGYGGYDLYYSEMSGGKWSSPVNLGEDINSEADEFRPVIGNISGFSNLPMVFSSNRDGGSGGYDLYIVGISSWSSK